MSEIDNDVAVRVFDTEIIKGIHNTFDFLENTLMISSVMAGSQKAHTTLSNGSTGDEVKYVQVELKRFYASGLVADGLFSTQTEAEVKRFQKDCALRPDGIVGAQTWNYLETIIPYANTQHTIVRKGSNSSEVKYLQVRLNGYFNTGLKVDGAFGDQTEAMVRRFQSAQKLAIDGIVGAATWRAIDQPNLDV